MTPAGELSATGQRTALNNLIENQPVDDGRAAVIARRMDTTE